MKDFNTKVNAPASGDQTFSAEEANNLFTENENAVLAGGLTLDNTGVDVNQLALSMARHSQGAKYFVDSGSANAKVLTKQNNFRPVTSYFAGMEVCFYVLVSNTGATTINIDGAGVVSVRNEFGRALTANDLTLGNLVTLIYDGTNFRIKDRGINLPYISGDSTKNYTISNAVGDVDNDITISSGCVLADNGKTFLYSDNVITKQLDATWVSGTGLGGRFASVSLSSNTTYHLFIIRQDTTGIIDAGFDTSINATNRPSGWTHYARIGSIITTSGSTITQFFQYGRYFGWKVPHNLTFPAFGTTANAANILVPNGIKVLASLSAGWRTNSDSSNYLYLSSPDATNVSASTSAFTVMGGVAGRASDDSANSLILTGTTQNIRWRISNTSSHVIGSVFINTNGYYDYI